MFRKCCFMLLLAGSPSVALALEATMSHAVFYMPDPIYKGNMNPYVEAYWQVNPKTLHYNTDTAKGIIARIKTDVLIFNDTGGLVKEDHYIYQTVGKARVEDLQALNILELKRYFITRGFTRIELTLTDVNDTNNKCSVTDTFTVPPKTNGPFFGGPELIDTSFAADARTPFRKHGAQYIPLCISFYENYRSSLNYYGEIYQFSNVAGIDYPLTQSVYISKKQNQSPYEKYLRLDTLSDSSRGFFDGSFDISDLPSGNYYLNFSIGDRGHNTLAHRSIFFQRMNTLPPKVSTAAAKAARDTMVDNINVLDLEKTFVAKYDNNHLKAILKMLLPVSNPVATRAIQSLLKKPDDLYVRYFIYNHFVGINKAKPEKAWKEYAEKVKEVNKMYGSNGRLGYETERGFMYLRYGPPSENIPVLHENGALPYELWQYNLLTDMTGKHVSNAVVLFYKSSETDFDFRVLHTNIPGELHNIGWRSFLFTNAEGGNPTSVAEQYIGKK